MWFRIKAIALQEEDKESSGEEEEEDYEDEDMENEDEKEEEEEVGGRAAPPIAAASFTFHGTIGFGPFNPFCHHINWTNITIIEYGRTGESSF